MHFDSQRARDSLGTQGLELPHLPEELLVAIFQQQRLSMLAVKALLRSLFTLGNIRQEAAGPDLSRGKSKEGQASPLALSLHIANAFLLIRPLI